MVTQILAVLGIMLLLWILFKGIQNNKEAFSKENLSKSFSTLGFLALILIATISFAVMILKRS